MFKKQQLKQTRIAIALPCDATGSRFHGWWAMTCSMLELLLIFLPRHLVIGQFLSATVHDQNHVIDSQYLVYDAYRMSTYIYIYTDHTDVCIYNI